MLRRTASLALLAASLGLGACVFGFRGEASVEAVYPLAGVDVVRVDLGPTPLTVLGDDLAVDLELSGAWRSIGGTGPRSSPPPSSTWWCGTSRAPTRRC